MFSLSWIGVNSLVIIVIYLISVRLVYSYEKRRIASFIKKSADELKYTEVSMNTAVKKYILNALVVIAAAIFLPEIGEGIAVKQDWGRLLWVQP